MNWTILSPCGTSLLTNRTDEDLRKLLISKSNDKNPESIPEDDAERISEHINCVSAFLQTASQGDVCEASAELNAIVKLYHEHKRQRRNTEDFHWLLCTDTWLGETAAKLVKEWLNRQGLNAEVHRQTDLQTQTIDGFQLSLSELTKWCYENLPPPNQQHSKVIFNLTGGFKSVNGFLQTLGMFRADEIVYIFEGEQKLLSIPRLPIGLASKELIKQHLQDFRRLSLGLEIRDNPSIPETFLLRIGNETTLSPWGELQWNECKKEVYSEQLHPSPDEQIVVGKTLSSEAKSHSHKYREMNEQIDRLLQYFASGKQQHLNSLSFEKVKGSENCYEFKAWDDEQGFRFFGHYEGEKFVIDELKRGLH